MIRTAPAFAHNEFSNKCSNFHKGIFKTMETVSEPEKLGLSDKQGIERVHGRLFANYSQSKTEKVPRGIRGEKSRHGKFEEFVLNNWSISKSQNGGRNQVSGRVSVPCWHATPVANAPWKPLIIGEGQARYQGHEIGGKSDWLGSHCWSRIRMPFNIRERDTSYCWIRSPYRP